MSNFHPETGIRFGVIAGNTVHPDVLNELMSGTSVTYTNAYNEERKRLINEWTTQVEDSTELKGSQTDPDWDIMEHVRFTLSVPEDIETADEYAEFKLEEFSDTYQCDEECYEGVKDGVKFGVTYLGGAILVWAFEGLEGFAAELCSPCVPGAANLDGGWKTAECVDGSDDDSITEEYPYHCYVIPKSWLNENATTEQPKLF